MKSTFIKKAFAVTLATTLVAGMSLAAFAAPTTEAASSSSSTVAATMVGEVPATVTTASGETTSSGGETTTPPATEGSNVVSGQRTTIAGQNFATIVNGLATLTPSSQFKLASSEKPYFKASNFDAKKSTLCKAVIDYMVTSMGLTAGPSWNMEYGKMAGGVYSVLPNDGTPIIQTVGIPGNFRQPGATYEVLKISSTGIDVLQDWDNSDATITMVTTPGRATYTMVR